MHSIMLKRVNRATKLSVWSYFHAVISSIAYWNRVTRCAIQYWRCMYKMLCLSYVVKCCSYQVIVVIVFAKCRCWRLRSCAIVRYRATLRRWSTVLCTLCWLSSGAANCQEQDTWLGHSVIGLQNVQQLQNRSCSYKAQAVWRSVN